MPILDGAFFSSFRPADQRRPLWLGNVKKLRLTRPDEGSGASYLDARGNDGIAADGRIADGALTFWTPTASLGSQIGRAHV